MGNSKIITKLNEILSPIAEKNGNQRHLKAISSGMMFGLPFIVIGSFFLIFANPPINIDHYNPETANFFMKIMAGWKDFAVANYDLITAPYNLTMGIIGLISVFGIAFSLANEYKTNPSMNGMVASVIYLMVCTPVTKGTINLNYLGTNGLFVAIIIGLLVVEVNRVFEVKNIKLKLPDTVPPMVATFINTLVPLLTNIILFYGINLIFLATTKKIFPETVMQVLTPATNIAGSLGGFLLIVTLGNILWLFGINGSSIIFPIVFTLGMAQTGLNAEQMANIEVAKYIPKFKKMGLSIIRKGNKEFLNSSDFSYLEEEIDDWIDSQTIPSMLIEKIAKIDEKNENKFSTNHQLIDPDCKYSENRNQFIVYFTKNQRKLLYYLYIANGTCVSRNDLCQLMWGEKISDSPLSQLSTLVANMREKLVNSGFDERDIKTVWGKGYFLSSEFMDFLTQNKIFTQGQLSKYF